MHRSEPLGSGARRPAEGQPAPRRLRAVALLAATAMLAASAAVVAPLAGTAWAGIKSDQAQEAQIEQQIVSQGAQIQSLVAKSDLAQATEAADQARVEADTARLAADKHRQQEAMAQLRRVAVHAYVTQAALEAHTPVLSVLGAGTATTELTRKEYSDVAAGNLGVDVDNLLTDEQRTNATETADESATSQARTEVATLAADKSAAQSALSQEEATLSQVKSNLQTLLAAAQRQAAAQQQAAERALAAQQQATQQALAAQLLAQQQARAHPPPPPPPSTAPLGSGGYSNPLRAIAALSPERIDQGVDYSGYGPIYAIGDGVVLSTVNSGWPGGTFIAYRLTSGPAAGLAVYAAEDINPAVSIGQQVTPSTVLGTMYEGPDGIETGWSDPSGDGDTMARDYGQFSGTNSTAFGYNFSQLLQSVGAPGGVLQNTPPTGTLPPGWPQW
ncbi:MAG: M23 family metallopeptidase [Actinomycetota bacterium]|nr:M23 family metallopeptidase [Actinomycetota bacterium]